MGGPQRGGGQSGALLVHAVQQGTQVRGSGCDDHGVVSVLTRCLGVWLAGLGKLVLFLFGSIPRIVFTSIPVSRYVGSLQGSLQGSALSF